MDDWLEAQRLQQVETFGIDPASLEGEERQRYVIDMALALSDEVHELVRTCQWKPWKSDKGEMLESYERVVDELADCLAFLANLTLALGVTDTGHVSSQIKIKQKNVRNRQSAYGNDYRRIFFAENGPSPWLCYFCREDVSHTDLVVHHVDKNRLNNSVDNLVPSHHGCHNAFHARARFDEERLVGPYACIDCGTEYATFTGLMSHHRYAQTHDGVAPSKGKKFEITSNSRGCPKCGVVTHSLRGQNLHERKCTFVPGSETAVIELWAAGYSVTAIEREVPGATRRHVLAVLEQHLGSRPDVRYASNPSREES